MSTDIPFILDALQSSSSVEVQVRFACTFSVFIFVIRTFKFFVCVIVFWI